MEHISWQNPFINNGGPNFSSVMAMFGSSTIFQAFYLLLFAVLWTLVLYWAPVIHCEIFLTLLFFVILKVSFWSLSLIFQFDFEVELKWYKMFSKHYIFYFVFQKYISRDEFLWLWLLKNHNVRSSATENSNINKSE